MKFFLRVSWNNILQNFNEDDKIECKVSLFTLFVTSLNAQAAYSLVKYVDEYLTTMEKHSLYSKQLNRDNIRDAVRIKLRTAVSARDVDYKLAASQTGPAYLKKT